MRLEDSREDIVEEERTPVEKATKKPVKDFPCAQCTQVCKNQYHLGVHMKAKHEQKEYKCKYCTKTWPTNTQNNGHQSRCSKRPESQTITLEEEDLRFVGNLGHYVFIVIIVIFNYCWKKCTCHCCHNYVLLISNRNILFFLNVKTFTNCFFSFVSFIRILLNHYQLSTHFPLHNFLIFLSLLRPHTEDTEESTDGATSLVDSVLEAANLHDSAPAELDR